MQARRLVPQALASLVVLAASAAPAFAAWHIPPHLLAETRRVVNAIQIDARQAHQEAERYANWNDWNERNAVGSVRNLLDAAQDLDREIESAWPEPVQLDVLYGRVTRADLTMRQQARFLRAYAPHRFLFQRLSDSVTQLRMLRGDGTGQGQGQALHAVRQHAQALRHSTRDLVTHAQDEGQFDPYKRSAVQAMSNLVHANDQLAQALTYAQHVEQVRPQLRQLQATFAQVRQTVTAARFSQYVLGAFNQVSRQVTDLQRAANQRVPSPRPLPPGQRPLPRVVPGIGR